jgi:predicted transcriptional regulator
MGATLNSIPLKMEVAQGILSIENCRLISLIHHKKPGSIKELCELSGRAQPNVSRSLILLAEHGIVKMTGTRPKRPELTSKDIVINLTSLVT